MSDLMGKMHYSEPVTDSDKEMSKRHKKNRKKIDKMADGPDKTRKSMFYNEMHAKEHLKAMKDAHKQMKKMGK